MIFGLWKTSCKAFSARVIRQLLIQGLDEKTVRLNAYLVNRALSKREAGTNYE